MALPAPDPGFYEGDDGLIYEVIRSKAGNWYAMRLRWKRPGLAERIYVGHRVRLGERIAL